MFKSSISISRQSSAVKLEKWLESARLRIEAVGTLKKEERKKYMKAREKMKEEAQSWEELRQ
jgi:hypothetical protein